MRAWTIVKNESIAPSGVGDVNYRLETLLSTRVQEPSAVMTKLHLQRSSGPERERGQVKDGLVYWRREVDVVTLFGGGFVCENLTSLRPVLRKMGAENERLSSCLLLIVVISVEQSTS